MKELNAIAKFARAFAPADKTSSITGTTIDVMGFDEAVFYWQLGAVTGTSPTLDFKIQSSADDSDWTDSTVYVVDQLTAGTDQGTLRIDLRVIGKRYIRIYGTIAGTSPHFLATGVFVLGAAHSEPVTQPTS